MVNKYSKSLIVDGNYLLHYSIPYKTTDGGPLTPAFNFLSKVSKFIFSGNYTRVYICWDSGIPERRKQVCPTYKAGRSSAKKQPSVFSFQDNVNFLKQFLSYANTIQVIQQGAEADDAIYGLTKSSENDMVIVSADMDLVQLVSNNVSVFRPYKSEMITHDTIKSILLDESYQIRPRNGLDIIAWKALRGDSSDRIPTAVRPKVAANIWATMQASNLSGLFDDVVEAARMCSVELTEQYVNNYTAVDLSRSGVAADSIIIGMSAHQQQPIYSENYLMDLFSYYGMQPSYLHSICSSLQSLR